MILKSIDLALMAEHLTAHKGVINKLHVLYCSADDPKLQQVIYEQIVIMNNHVKVMLMLIDPARNEHVTVAALTQVEPADIDCRQKTVNLSDQNIALEGRDTAKTMAHNNFSSSLRMKASNVRDIHMQMSIQQYKLQEKYSDIIEKNNWEKAPSSSKEEQLKTLKDFTQFFS